MKYSPMFLNWEIDLQSKKQLRPDYCAGVAYSQGPGGLRPTTGIQAARPGALLSGLGQN